MRVPGPLLLALFACAGLSGCVDVPRGNYLADPGFEAGADDWFFFEGRDHWASYTIAENPVFSGNRSARTLLESRPDGPLTLVVGAIQEVTRDEAGDRIPERLAGNFRVESWSSLANKTYMQVVIGAFPEEHATEPLCPGVPPTSPCQLAYVLGGVDEIPIPVRNRHFFFLGTEVPAPSEWYAFERNVRDDFMTGWGVVPDAFDHVWIYLETRYEDDGGRPGPRAVRVDSYWDDIYLGSF